jgi:hypothetical protein
MTKKNNLNLIKHLKPIVKDKERDDKQTRQRNRRGSINLPPQVGVTIEEFTVLAKFAKLVGVGVR